MVSCTESPLSINKKWRHNNIFFYNYNFGYWCLWIVKGLLEASVLMFGIEKCFLVSVLYVHIHTIKIFQFFYILGDWKKNFTFVITNSKQCYLTPFFRYLIVHMQLSSTNFIVLMVQCVCMHAVLSALSLLIFHEISCLAGSS